MQVALRDKEELLVQKAFERIRRAQMLGMKNVKLTKPELDALERKQQKDEALKSSAMRRRSGANLRKEESHRSSGQSSSIPKEQKSAKRKSKGYFSTYDDENTSKSRRDAPPGVPIPGIGIVGFSPVSQYESVQGRSSPSGSRNVSSHSLAKPSPPTPRGSRKRQSSTAEPPQVLQPPRSPNMSRRLPDDADWLPRPRSTSSMSAQSYAIDPYQFQTYSPPLSQVPPLYGHYTQGRRIVSSPQPNVHMSQNRAEAPLRSSESSSLRREHSGQLTSEASESDDGEDNGVQVNVLPNQYGHGYNASTLPEGGSWGRLRRSGR